MTEIIPGILEEDFEEIHAKIAEVRQAVAFVQLDVCDGEFVSSTTWPYGDPDTFSKILSGEIGLPFWEDVQFEIDLMVARPEEVIGDWIDAGASRIIVHKSSTEKLGDILTRLEEAQIERGVALKIEDNPADLRDLASRIDFFQCMGIVEIGVQGQPFDERVLEKIKSISAQFPDKPISVDGGVSLDSAPRLIEAGASRLVAGSAIFEADDPKEAIEQLKNL